MTRTIAIISGKGGTGKTFLTANLGIALSLLGKNVVAIDANLTTPNLGFHLGLPLYTKTLHDVLKNKIMIENAIYLHESGLKIVPGGISIKDLQNLTPQMLSRAILGLVGRHDYILVDGSAGIGKETIAGLESTDESIVVIQPELTSVIDALKVITLAENIGNDVLGVVINMARKRYALKTKEIENIVERKVLATIPYHKHVQRTIYEKTPILLHKPRHKISKEIKRLAMYL